MIFGSGLFFAGYIPKTKNGHAREEVDMNVFINQDLFGSGGEKNQGAT